MQQLWFSHHYKYGCKQQLPGWQRHRFLKWQFNFVCEIINVACLDHSVIIAVLQSNPSE